MDISFIIPNYNKANYISKCVESITKNIKFNYEIIIVDDGSKDNSLDIINELISNNSNVKLLSQVNSGVSIARNNGLIKSTGKFIMFVDPDDTLNSTELNEVVGRSINNNYDLQIFNYNIITNSKIEQVTDFITDKYINVDERNNILSKILYNNGQRTILGSSCRVIVKRSILEDNIIKFNSKLFMSEDLIWLFEVILKSDQIFISNLQVYNYYVNSDSVVNNYKNNLIQNYELLSDLIKVQLEENYLIKELAISFECFNFNLFKQIYFNEIQDNYNYVNTKKIDSSLCFTSAIKDNLSNKDKLFYFLIKNKIITGLIALVKIIEIKNK